jgi:hypothetical protein
MTTVKRRGMFRIVKIDGHYYLYARKKFKRNKNRQKNKGHLVMWTQMKELKDPIFP